MTDKEITMRNSIQKSILGLGLVGAFVACTPQAEIDSGFHKVLTLNGVSFDVRSEESSSLGTVFITPSGLEENKLIKEEVDGRVIDAQVADLNSDGSPELYIFATSAGSGSIGSLIAYGTNNKKSLTPIFLPEISEDTKYGQGYMGHDSFKIVGNRLTRSFPIYKKDDPNCCPTGGKRTVEYKLVAGEAGWILRAVTHSERKESK